MTGHSVDTWEILYRRSLCPVVICPYLCSSELRNGVLRIWKRASEAVQITPCVILCKGVPKSGHELARVNRTTPADRTWQIPLVAERAIVIVVSCLVFVYFNQVLSLFLVPGSRDVGNTSISRHKPQLKKEIGKGSGAKLSGRDRHGSCRWRQRFADTDRGFQEYC